MDQGGEEVRGGGGDSHKSGVVICRSYPIYDLIKIRHPIYDSCGSVAGTFALIVSYDGLLLTVLLIMMKQALLLRNRIPNSKLEC